MIIFQLWHMSEKLRQGSLPDRMPVSVELCPANVTAVAAANHTILAHERGSNSSFDLTELSAYWSNFFTTILTMVLGLIISLFTGGRKTYKQYLYLTSDVFVGMWSKAGLIDHDFPDEQQSSSAMMTEKTYKFQDPRIIKLTDEADISSSTII
ncbi:hypothetical protein ISCGN_020908 [Ixodes scapularis]